VIKLWGDSKDGKQMICVLEPGNIERVMKQQPIQIDLNDGPYKAGLPAKLKLLILYSETPIADSREIEKWLAPEGVKLRDERTPAVKTRGPHCPECKSTIEQLGVWRNESPMALAFCTVCGCVFGMVPHEIVKVLKPSVAETTP